MDERHDRVDRHAAVAEKDIGAGIDGDNRVEGARLGISVELEEDPGGHGEPLLREPRESGNRREEKEGRTIGGNVKTTPPVARKAAPRANTFSKTGRAQKPRNGWTSSRLATISAAVGLPCIALAIAIFVAL